MLKYKNSMSYKKMTMSVNFRYDTYPYNILNQIKYNCTMLK